MITARALSVAHDAGVTAYRHGGLRAPVASRVIRELVADGVTDSETEALFDSFLSGFDEADDRKVGRMLARWAS